MNQEEGILLEEHKYLVLIKNILIKTQMIKS